MKSEHHQLQTNIPAKLQVNMFLLNALSYFWIMKMEILHFLAGFVVVVVLIMDDLPAPY